MDYGLIDAFLFPPHKHLRILGIVHVRATSYLTFKSYKGIDFFKFGFKKKLFKGTLIFFPQLNMQI